LSTVKAGGSSAARRLSSVSFIWGQFRGMGRLVFGAENACYQ
jgi:hypothetical protein